MFVQTTHVYSISKEIFLLNCWTCNCWKIAVNIIIKALKVSQMEQETTVQ